MWMSPMTTFSSHSTRIRKRSDSPYRATWAARGALWSIQRDMIFSRSRDREASASARRRTRCWSPPAIASAPESARLDEIDAYSVTDKFSSGLEAEVAHDFVFVGFRRPCRDVENFADFLHRATLRQQAQDVALA